MSPLIVAVFIVGPFNRYPCHRVSPVTLAGVHVPDPMHPGVDVNVAEAIVAGLPPVTFTARAVPPGPIAFRSNRHAEAGGFGYDIFVMNEDGTDPVQLTTDPADEFDAAWSPDGSA